MNNTKTTSRPPTPRDAITENKDGCFVRSPKAKEKNIWRLVDTNHQRCYTLEQKWKVCFFKEIIRNR